MIENQTQEVKWWAEEDYLAGPTLETFRPWDEVGMENDATHLVGVYLNDDDPNAVADVTLIISVPGHAPEVRTIHLTNGSVWTAVELDCATGCILKEINRVRVIPANTVLPWHVRSATEGNAPSAPSPRPSAIPANPLRPGSWEGPNVTAYLSWDAPVDVNFEIVATYADPDYLMGKPTQVGHDLGPGLEVFRPWDIYDEGERSYYLGATIFSTLDEYEHLTANATLTICIQGRAPFVMRKTLPRSGSDNGVWMACSIDPSGNIHTIDRLVAHPYNVIPGNTH